MLFVAQAIAKIKSEVVVINRKSLGYYAYFPKGETTKDWFIKVKLVACCFSEKKGALKWAMYKMDLGWVLNEKRGC